MQKESKLFFSFSSASIFDAVKDTIEYAWISFPFDDQKVLRKNGGKEGYFYFFCYICRRIILMEIICKINT